MDCFRSGNLNVSIGWEEGGKFKQGTFLLHGPVNKMLRLPMFMLSH